MTTAPALALRTDADAPALLPHNIEAEQAVLGTILFDNGAYERIDGLKPEQFYVSYHSRLYAVIEAALQKGTLADPIMLMERFKNDPAYKEMGEVRYLADLVDHAPPAHLVRDYARMVSDLALKRSLIELSDDIGHEARLGASTGAEQLTEAEQKLFGLAETGKTGGGFVTFADSLAKSLESTAAAYERDGGLSGLATGLTDLDQKLGGMHASDLIILAARPSMGKTALATNIAFHIARHYAWEQRPDGGRKTTAGGVVAFFSLEMSDEQLASRILAEVSGIPSDAMRKGTIKPFEYSQIRDAAMEINAAPLYTDATGALNIGRLAARARRLKRTVGLDLVVVDYLQLATAQRKGGDGRVQEVTEVTQGLKALAKELGVPVLALSQLSRKVEERDDKRPQLADLRESGSIEQDADVVMFLYREEYYLGRAEPKEGTPDHMAWQTAMEACRGKADLIIGKQRHGPIGTVRLAFNETLTKFGNLAREGRFSAASDQYRDHSGSVG